MVRKLDQKFWYDIRVQTGIGNATPLLPKPSMLKHWIPGWHYETHVVCTASLPARARRQHWTLGGRGLEGLGSIERFCAAICLNGIMYTETRWIHESVWIHDESDSENRWIHESVISDENKEPFLLIFIKHLRIHGFIGFWIGFIPDSCGFMDSSRVLRTRACTWMRALRQSMHHEWWCDKTLDNYCKSRNMTMQRTYQSWTITHKNDFCGITPWGHL